jgi:hypothetical protein
MKESSLNANSNTVEPDRPQHDRPAACVIAQQYSSATVFSFRFDSRKEKFGSHFKKFVSSFLKMRVRNRVA